MPERFLVGDTVKLTNTFKVSGTATDPTSVTLTVTDPSGNDTTPSPTNSATGVYTYDLAVDEAGVWIVKWEGDSPAADVSVSTVTVYAAAPESTNLLTLEEAKLAVGASSTEQNRDALLESAVAAVTAKIEEHAGPVLQRTITSEQVQVNPDDRSVVRVQSWPVNAWTTVTEYNATGTSTTLTAEDYDTKPDNGYRPRRVEFGTGTYTGHLERRNGSAAGLFPSDGWLVVTYTAGRYATLTEAGAERFKTCARLALKNLWRAFESSVVEIDGYDMPYQSWPSKYALPDSVKALLGDDLRGVMPPDGEGTVLIG